MNREGQRGKLERNMQRSMAAQSALRQYHSLQKGFELWHGLKKPDPLLLLSWGMILAIGCFAVASASMPVAQQLTGDPYYFITRHCLFLVMSLLAALVVYHIPTYQYQRREVLFLLMGVATLLCVLIYIPGVAPRVKGSARWLSLGSVNIQVSEMAKLVVVIYTAAILTQYESKMKSSASLWNLAPWTNLVVCFLPVIFLLILIILQPDFSSTLLLALTVGAMMWTFGVPLKRLLPVLILVVIAVVFLMERKGYPLNRIRTYLNPWEDAQGSGYQIVHSMIAIGQGGLTGKGIGESILKHHYLPEPHTDFVFSIFAEETGFIGMISVIGLYALLCVKGLRLSIKAFTVNKIFCSILSAGIVIWLSGQTVLNISVVTKLLPTTGITLPFMSYGGSSLLVCCVAMAILLRIDSETAYEHQLLTIKDEATIAREREINELER